MRDYRTYHILPYNPALQERAKELRKAGNQAEAMMWRELKSKQFLGLDFDRQKIIGNYIVDFFCAERGVVIEIDGGSHFFDNEYAVKRDEFLRGLELEVVRFRDRDVRYALAEVMHELYCNERFADLVKL